MEFPYKVNKLSEYEIFEADWLIHLLNWIPVENTSCTEMKEYFAARFGYEIPKYYLLSLIFLKFWLHLKLLHIY